ncbi:MAG: signal peptidase I [Planctomycetota bacterium]
MLQPSETGPVEAGRETRSTTLEHATDPAAAPATDTGGLASLFEVDPGARGARDVGQRHATLRPRELERPPLVLRLVSGASKAVLMVALLWGLFFNFSEVRGSSMRPGIQDGDRILVDHVSYMFEDVARGDIVVLRYPLDPTVDYVKRVVGLPGEHIEIFRGQVWIDGARVEEDYVAEENLDPWAVVDTVVEPGHYFVLGDNRLRSSDSRDFGQVAEVYLRGKVRARLWPAARVGLIH